MEYKIENNRIGIEKCLYKDGKYYIKLVVLDSCSYIRSPRVLILREKLIIEVKLTIFKVLRFKKEMIVIPSDKVNTIVVRCN